MRALIVTVGRARGALAAVRALSSAGWVVGVGTPDGKGMVTASRWCQYRHVVPRPRGRGEGFVEGIRRAVHEVGYDVLFGGADDWMAALATYRDRVPTRVAHPAADTVAAAVDKLELIRRALAAGLVTPRTEAATDEVLAGWAGPVVVKCRAHWHPGQRHEYRIEARRYPDVAAATDRVRLLRDLGFDPILQETVDGRLGALIGLFHEGRLVGRVQQETSRLWPTPSGVSARAETVPVDEDLSTRAAALLTDLGWSGLVELQFLTDARGVRHLIDMNGRFYGSMALAIAAGVNLPDAWARQVLGRPEPYPEDARTGVRFVWTAGDLRRASKERRGGLVRDVLSTLRWARTATDSVWDRRDLGPTRELIAARLRRTARESVE
jgi:predicted ATP-grasp superfamily ATP-dependent carboligase